MQFASAVFHFLFHVTTPSVRSTVVGLSVIPFIVNPCLTIRLVLCMCRYRRVETLEYEPLLLSALWWSSYTAAVLVLRSIENPPHSRRVLALVCHNRLGDAVAGQEGDRRALGRPRPPAKV